MARLSFYDLMTSNYLFNTGGSWETTYLLNHGQEVATDRLFLQITVERNALDRRIGGEMTAYVDIAGSGGRVAVFPGRLEIDAPGHNLVVENIHPRVQFDQTRVWYEQVEITEQVFEVFVEVDSPQNNVQGFVTLFKGRLIGPDKLETFSVL